MIFEEQKIKGMYKIDLDKKGDDRGFFARVFCKNEYDELDLDHDLVQINRNYSKDKGIFRGMHYQLPPKAEDKIAFCTHGACYDITLDLRPNSPTFGQWNGIELHNDNRTMLYIPKGCAHGYLILEENTEIFYFVTEYYSPDHERVIKWDDPRFDIKLPFMPTEVSEKDANAPSFDEEWHLEGMEQLL